MLLTSTKQFSGQNYCVCLSGVTHLFAYTHAKFERMEALLKGQAHCLKTVT